MQNANELLKNAYPFKEEDELENVLNFYKTKNFAKETILTWTETLDYVRKNPEVTIEEILENKGLPTNHLDEQKEVFKRKN